MAMVFNTDELIDSRQQHYINDYVIVEVKGALQLDLLINTLKRRRTLSQTARYCTTECCLSFYKSCNILQYGGFKWCALNGELVHTKRQKLQC